MVRSALGWRFDDPEKEQVRARAEEVVDAVWKGKPLPEGAPPMLALECEPYLNAWTMFNEPIAARLKKLLAEARKFPVYDWCSSIRGLGGGVALVTLVGEAGNALSGYKSKGALIKRYGLWSPDGKSAPTWRREGGLSAEQWTYVGYSPQRRSRIYTVGQSLVKLNFTKKGKGAPPGKYRQIYLDAKVKAAERHPDWKKQRVDFHGQRVMMQKLTKDIWSVWRAADRVENSQKPA